MQYSFPALAIARLRELHKKRDFQELCNAFDAFVDVPTLFLWRGWIDVFFVYDAQWSDAFFQYHKRAQTSASRAICLILVYRKTLYIRGNTVERSCDEQEQLIRDITLATHGLLQPLLQDVKYNNVGFIIESLLHTVDAKSLDAQWRMHVVPQLKEGWRLIFLWGQVTIVMAHGAAREAIDEVLSDCELHERQLLEPLGLAYLSTDEQLAEDNEVVLFSNDAICGDMFSIDMAEYCFEQNDDASALAWIENKLPNLYDVPNANEWLDGAREMVETHAPSSALFIQLIEYGVAGGLLGALHTRALESDENALLLKNSERGHSDSMVALAERLRYQEQGEEARVWLLRAAALFNSEALYCLGDTASLQGLTYLTQAVQRLHGQALFDVALGVLNGDVQWKNHRVLLQTEGVDFDPPQVVELLEKARDAGIGEAATLLFDILSNYVDDATFFAMCYTAGQVDPLYVQEGYARALALGQSERIFEWAQLMLIAVGNREDVLFELGVAAHWLGRTHVATKSWTDAANKGHAASAQKLDDFRTGRLPVVIVPNNIGWQRTWRGLAEKFKRR